MSAKPLYSPNGKRIAHGTNNAYTNYGCRCDKCRKANREAHKKWVAKARRANR